MKLHYLSILVVLTIFLANIGLASDKKENKSGKKGDSEYLVITTHTDAECMDVLDKMSENNKYILGKTWFGCMSGNHSGYSILEAKDENALKDMLPAYLKENAKIIKVGMFTVDQIKKFHALKEKSKS